jgi:acetyl-CoA C-acetyltransferase
MYGKRRVMSIYILSGSRTPMGSFMGELSSVKAPQLGAAAIKGALAKTDVKQVDEVFMGNVIQAGVGQAPARQAALFAGLEESVMCTTVNKVCGSGLQSVILGARSIAVGDSDVVVAGGMENMSLAPGLLPNYRNGFKFGPSEIKDSMQWDGLWDVYSDRPMGNCAEECTKKYKFNS